MLNEGIFFNMKMQRVVQVAEECFPQMVAIADDNSIFISKIAQ